MNSHFREAGTYHVDSTSSEGLVVANCSLENGWQYAISLVDTDNCAITNSNFAKSDGTAANGDSSLSVKGNIYADALSTGNVIARNKGGAGA
jgi:hypothetical protein